MPKCFIPLPFLLLAIVACNSREPAAKKDRCELLPRSDSQSMLYGAKCTVRYPQDSLLSFLMDKSEFILHGSIVKRLGGSIDASWITWSYAVKVVENVKGKAYADTIVIGYPQPLDFDPNSGKEATPSVLSDLVARMRSEQDNNSLEHRGLFADGSELVLFLKSNPDCSTQYNGHKYNCLFPADTWFSAIPYSARVVAVMNQLLGKS
jgi:hypothetical protein